MARVIPKWALTGTNSSGSLVVPVTVSSTVSYSTEPRIIRNPTTASLKRGTGGRSSFNGIVCTVFGSTGFLGRYVCNRLGKIGTQLVLPYREDFYFAKHLKLCGDLGQVYFTPFRLEDEESIEKAVKHSNVVLNLIGREWDTRNFTMEDVHIEGARRIARISKQCGVERLIHVSSLNAHPMPQPLLTGTGSRFYKSKWAGECAVKEEFPEVTIVRPANIYGLEDRFLRVYTAYFRKHFGLIPMWKKGDQTLKQPVWVSDVAAGIVNLILNSDTAGKTYQFVGPKRYKLGDLVQWFNDLVTPDTSTEAAVQIIDLDRALLFQLQLFFNELLPTYRRYGILTREMIEQESTTDTVDKSLPMLQDLGIEPVTVDRQIPLEIRPLMIGSGYMSLMAKYEPRSAPQPVPFT